MKITGRNILLAVIVGGLLLVGIVSADDYCTPFPNDITTSLDHSGTWYNFTLRYPVCYVCVDNGAGYGDVDCTLCPDADAPASITGLSGSSTSCGRILWTWTDPADGDLEGVQMWVNGTFNNNVLAGVQSKLTSHTTTGVYELGTRTYDTFGNMNTTWVNATANVTACSGTGGVTVVGNDDSSMSIIMLIGSIIAGLVAIGARSLWT